MCTRFTFGHCCRNHDLLVHTLVSSFQFPKLEKGAAVLNSRKAQQLKPFHFICKSGAGQRRGRVWNCLEIRSRAQEEETEACHGVGVQVSGRAVSLGGMKSQVLLVDINLIYTSSEPGSDRLGPTELGNLFTTCYRCLQRFFLLIPISGVTDGYEPRCRCWK